MPAYRYKFKHGKAGTISTQGTIDQAKESIKQRFPKYQLIDMQPIKPPQPA